MIASPASACKVLTSAEMAELRETGSFAGSPLDRADGFIHMSMEDQLGATLARHFAGQKGLWLVTVDLGKLGDPVRWEPARDGALFPHLYGVLPMEAVSRAAPLPDDRA